MDARSKLWEAAGRGRVRVRAELPNYLQSPLSLSLSRPFQNDVQCCSIPFWFGVRQVRPPVRSRSRSLANRSHQYLARDGVGFLCAVGPPRPRPSVTDSMNPPLCTNSRKLFPPLLAQLMGNSRERGGEGREGHGMARELILHLEGCSTRCTPSPVALT